MDVKKMLNTSIILYSIKYFLDNSSITKFSESIISNVLLFASLFFCLCFIAINIINRMSNNKLVSVKVLVVFTVFILSAILVYSAIPYTIFLMYFFYVIAARYANVEEMLRCILMSMSTMLGILFILSIVGIIPNFEHIKGEYCLGLATQVFSWYLFNICAIYLYLHRNNLKKSMFIGFFILGWVFFFLTKTRLMIVILSILLIMVYLYKYKGYIFLKKIKSLYKFIFLICFGLIYFITVNYTSFPFINYILSGRPMFALRHLTNNGLSLFPRNISFFSIQVTNGTYTVYIDSGYMDLLIRFGIILLTVILLTYTFFISESIKKKQYFIMIWLICVAIFNIVNNSFMNIFYDSSMVLLWQCSRNVSENDKLMTYNE